MKESLQRITDWAKTHPWLTALIIGGVILIGYLVYKRSNKGGGAEGTAFEVPEGSAEVSPIPGLEGIPSPVTGGGGSSIPSSDLDISPMTGQPAPASFPEFASLPPATAGEFGSGWVAPDLGEMVSASFAPAEMDLGPSEVSGNLKNARGLGKASGSIVGTATGGKVPGQISKLGKAKVGLLGGKVQPSDVRPARQATTATGIVKKAVPKPAGLTTRPGRTPAERLGLYWLYTGPYNGIWYSFGYPIGVSSGITASGIGVASGGMVGGSTKSTRPGR